MQLMNSPVLDRTIDGFSTTQIMHTWKNQAFAKSEIAVLATQPRVSVRITDTSKSHLVQPDLNGSNRNFTACFVAVRNLPWCCCWALSTTYHQWQIRTCHTDSQHSRWCSPGYCCRWILVWLVWKSLFWCQGIQSFYSVKQSLLYPGNLLASREL